MRRSSAAAAAAFLALALAAVAAAQTPTSHPMIPAAPPASPSYPPNVTINVALTMPVSSETAHVGDTFSYNTTQDVKLGALDVPAGTPGKGRLAVVVPAQGDNNGQLSLQADEIDLPGGPVVWVNIDTTMPPHGHYSRSRTSAHVFPFLVTITKKSQGDLVLDVGTKFRVITIPPRAKPAPLLTAPPSAMPETSPAAVPAAGGAMTPAAMGSPAPVPSPTK